MADSLYTVFHKFCPQCATSVARDAENCSCGYSFNANATEDLASSLAQAIAEEKLYEDYLAARVTQTAQAAIAAQTVHQTAPQDPMYTMAARNAVEEAERSRAELAAQSAKVAEMEKALAAEREPAAKLPPKSVPPLHVVVVEPVAVATVPSASTPPAPIATSAPAATRVEPARPVAVVVPQREEPVRVTAVAPPVVAAPAMPAVTHEPARVLKKNLSSHANEVASAAEALRTQLAQMRSGRREAGHNDIQSQSVPQPSSKTAAAVSTSAIDTPAPQRAIPPMPAALKPANVNATRRPPVATKAVDEILEQANVVKKVKREAAQAAKAQQIQQARLARQAERARAAQSAPVAQTQRETPTAATADKNMVVKEIEEPAAAAPRAAPTLATPTMTATTPASPVVKTRECANCTASVALSVRRCKCGYEFPDLARATMPALALDPSDAKNVIDLYHRRR